MHRYTSLKYLVCLLGFLLFSSNFYSQTKIISTGDFWQFYDKKEAPPIGWEKSDEFTKSWEKGISPLGYGDFVIKTVLNFGDNPKEKYITTFFKKSFRLDNPHQYLFYSINLLRDDGAVVYLNGREIMRSNMPEGKITHLTLANSLVVMGKSEDHFYKKLLLPDDFIVGINTISVSVHKARKTSVDCIFDMELIGDNDPKLLPDLIKERSIKNLTFESKLKEKNYQQELKNKDLQYQLLNQSKSNIKGLLYGISLLLIVVILGFVYFWRFFSTKKIELEKKITALNLSIQNKHIEMMNISLNSFNNQQYFKSLKKELELNISKEVKFDKIEIKKIINQIDYTLGVNDDWEVLKKHFNAVHSGYYDKLFTLHPSLSEVELRHCVFIKLFMQTKEIASVLNIDPKSVQASRYRIKKKMKLDESTDLRDYLIKL